MSSDPFMGVQIHPFSPLDEGIEYCLDLLQETAGINTLLLYTHLYHAGTETPIDLIADHGVPRREPKKRNLRAAWVRHNPNAFTGTLLRHAPVRDDQEYADRDLFAELVEPCRKRGMRILTRILEPQGAKYAAQIEGWTQTLTIDLFGRPGKVACWNNPDYRRFWQCTVEDTFLNYDLDGFMFGAERTGPLSRMLSSGETPTCFCTHCQQRMERRGLDVERLRRGYTEIYDYVQLLRSGGNAGPDGAFITFFGLLMRYPEVLAWEREWAVSLEEASALLTGTVKALKPTAEVGRHVDHQQTTYDLVYRAASSYAEMARHLDFIKPVVYHDIAAPRVQKWFIDGWRKGVFQEFIPQQILSGFQTLTKADPGKEPTLDEMEEGGFSADYVYRETKRCVDSVQGATKVYAGVGFDVPFHTPEGPVRHPAGKPETVYEATRQAFAAGADGILVSREYQEMQVENLKAVGRALADWKATA
ncbi:MAG: hypothetical protein OHK0029_13710 [Armatimonadaceae bacterium]